MSRTVNRWELVTGGASPAPTDEVGVVTCLGFLRLRAKTEVFQQKTNAVCPFQNSILFCFVVVSIFGNTNILNILLLFCENLILLWLNVAFTKQLNWKRSWARKSYNPQPPNEQWFCFPVTLNSSPAFILHWPHATHQQSW